ncbi:hypothetical protein JKP88DRAFT_260824 [Tribonema minus]|uniref:Uncharacterized protein n=1 Tax=Tribonema minus TaxID=303371 RepID=A0A835ZHG1_9STRA|nr:hypothetical protein JKP88DRAFT_260824 [Tribonema minus]
MATSCVFVCLLQAFAKDLGQTTGKPHFDCLLPVTQVVGGGVLNINVPLRTDHLVVRGTYTTISLVIYGHVLPAPPAPPPFLGAALPPVLQPPPLPTSVAATAPLMNGAAAVASSSAAAAQVSQPLSAAAPVTSLSPPALSPPPVLPPAIAAAMTATPVRSSPSAVAPSLKPEAAAPAPAAAVAAAQADKPIPWQPTQMPRLPVCVRTSRVRNVPAPPGTSVDARSITEVDAQLSTAPLQLRALPPPTRLLQQLDAADEFSPQYLLPVGGVEAAAAAARRLRSTPPQELPAALRATAAALRQCFAHGGGGGARRGEGRRVSSAEAFSGAVAEDLAEAVVAALAWCTDEGFGPAGGDGAFCDGRKTGLEGEAGVRAARAALQLLEAMLVAPSLAYAFAAAGGLLCLRTALLSHRVPAGLKALAMGALAQACQHESLLHAVSAAPDDGGESAYEAAVAAAMRYGARHGALRACAELVMAAVAALDCVRAAQDCAMEAGLAAVGEPPGASGGERRLAALSRALLGKDPLPPVSDAAQAAEPEGADAAAPPPLKRLPQWKPALAPSFGAKPLLELAQALFAMEVLLARPCLPMAGVALLDGSAIRGATHANFNINLHAANTAPAELLQEGHSGATAAHRGFSPALLRLLRRHGIVATLAVAAAAVGRAAVADCRHGGAAALAAAAAELLAAIRALALRLLGGGGEAFIGSLVFAAAPEATEVLVAALDGSALRRGARGGVLPLEALADGAPQAAVTPSALAHLLARAAQAAAVAEASLESTAAAAAAGGEAKGEERVPLTLRRLAQVAAASEAGRGAACAALDHALMPLLLGAKAAGAGAATTALLVSTAIAGVDSVQSGRALLQHWGALSDLVAYLARAPQPIADWGTGELAARLLDLRAPFASISAGGVTAAGLLASLRGTATELGDLFASATDGAGVDTSGKDIDGDKASDGGEGGDGKGAAAAADGRARMPLLCTELERMQRAAAPLLTLALAARMLHALADASRSAAYSLQAEGAIAALLRAAGTLTYALARKTNAPLARRLRAQRAVASATDAADGPKPMSVDSSESTGAEAAAEAAGVAAAAAMDVEDSATEQNGKHNAGDDGSDEVPVPPPHDSWSGDAAVADLVWPGPSETAAEEEALWGDGKGAAPALSPAERQAVAARHTRQVLGALVACLRLLRLLLRVLPRGGDDDAQLRDAVMAAILDGQAAIACLPLATAAADTTLPEGCTATPTTVLALRAESLIVGVCRLWLPPHCCDASDSSGGGGGGGGGGGSTEAHHQDGSASPMAVDGEHIEAAVADADGDEAESSAVTAASTMQLIYKHALAAPAHHLGALRLLHALLPPAVPPPLHRLPASLPERDELAARVRLAAAVERKDGLREAALDEVERHMAWHLHCWDLALTPAAAAASVAAASADGDAAAEGAEADAGAPRASSDGSIGALTAAMCHSSSPQVRALAADVAARAAGAGAATARGVTAALLADLQRCVDTYLAGPAAAAAASSEKSDAGGGAAPWLPVCRALQAVHALADADGGAARVALLLQGALAALLPCLGLPRPEPIRAALCALRPFCSGSGRAAEARRHGAPPTSFGVVATAARNVMGKWHRVDLRVHADGAQLLAALAAVPSCAAHVLGALRPRGAEAAGAAVGEGKTTMLLPRLYSGLVKGLEDAQFKYRARAALAAAAAAAREGGGSSAGGGGGGSAGTDARRGDDIDARVLLVARAACWAVLAPLALMTEGLVDAAEVAAVLIPAGTQPGAEPLTKLKAAAEAFVAQFVVVAPQVEALAAQVLAERPAAAAAATKDKKAEAAAAAARAAAAAVAEASVLRLLSTRQYLTVLQDAVAHLHAACEGARRQRSSADVRAALDAAAAAADAAAPQPLEAWFAQRPLVAEGGAPGGVLEETRSGRRILMESGGCFGCEELAEVIGEQQQLDDAAALRVELVDTPLVAAAGSALRTPAVAAARAAAVADAVKRARAAEPLEPYMWRVKRPKRQRTIAAAAAASKGGAAAAQAAGKASPSGADAAGGAREKPKLERVASTGRGRGASASAAAAAAAAADGAATSADAKAPAAAEAAAAPQAPTSMQQTPPHAAAAAAAPPPATAAAAPAASAPAAATSGDPRRRDPRLARDPRRRAS